MWQLMGNLFYRRQQIQVIYDMTFSEMKMWNEWHEIMVKEEERQIKGMK